MGRTSYSYWQGELRYGTQVAIEIFLYDSESEGVELP